jgi:hypothetical protein
MNWFTKHPASVGETYYQHFNYALSVAIVLFCLTIILVIHSILPFLFKNTVSTWLPLIMESFENRRNRVDKE